VSGEWYREMADRVLAGEVVTLGEPHESLFEAWRVGWDVMAGVRRHVPAGAAVDLKTELVGGGWSGFLPVVYMTETVRWP